MEDPAAPRPDVTVVVPTYARPDAIRACVAALQAQAGASLEIVVVDDGSPVPVADLPGGPHPLTMIRQANAGPAAARNAGVRAARAGLVALTDDDCRPHPGWAAAFLRASRFQPGALLGGATRNAAPGPFARTSQEMVDHLADLSADRPRFFPSNNIALPRNAYLAVGGFPEDYPLAAGEDRAFCRAWEASGRPFAAVPDAVIDHHHALTLGGFWRQHRNYGEGARTFHDTADAGPRRPGYAIALGLVAAPLRLRRSGVGPMRNVAIGAGTAVLVAVAQMATARGYARAARRGRT